MDSLTKESFIFLQLLIEERTGIKLSQNKSFLIYNRLLKIIRKYSLNSFEELIIKVRMGNEEIIQDIIETVTTNETYFFRDNNIYNELLNKIIPENFSAKDLNILVLASSTGQEAYSIAIGLLEQNINNFKITAIDINSLNISKAKKGIFNEFEISRGLTLALKVKYFDRFNETEYKIKDELKEYIKFQQGNLLNLNKIKAKFDMIFCRNALIYFEQDNIIKVLNEISNLSNKPAILVLGSSETFNHLPEKFTQPYKFRSILKHIS